MQPSKPHSTTMPEAAQEWIDGMIRPVYGGNDLAMAIQGLADYGAQAMPLATRN